MKLNIFKAVLFVVPILILSACTPILEVDDNPISEEEKKVDKTIIKYDEFTPLSRLEIYGTIETPTIYKSTVDSYEIQYDTQFLMQDTETGCIYIMDKYASSNRTPYYGSEGEVLGCKNVINK